MNISDFIVNDVTIQSIDQSIKVYKKLFEKLTYTHLPIEKNGMFTGCLSENDARCFEDEKDLKDLEYIIETFHVFDTDNWLDILETFTRNNSNLMPVLEKNTHKYLGYLELADILDFLNETPFLEEPGTILVVSKPIKEYSFSEIAQIVESNEGKVLGSFISKTTNDQAEITLKIGLSGLNEILQSFRRYGYKIESAHQEDKFLKNLKERSDYLDKYLNI